MDLDTFLEEITGIPFEALDTMSDDEFNGHIEERFGVVAHTGKLPKIALQVDGVERAINIEIINGTVAIVAGGPVSHIPQAMWS